MSILAHFEHIQGPPQGHLGFPTLSKLAQNSRKSIALQYRAVWNLPMATKLKKTPKMSILAYLVVIFGTLFASCGTVWRSKLVKTDQKYYLEFPPKFGERIRGGKRFGQLLQVILRLKNALFCKSSQMRPPSNPETTQSCPIWTPICWPSSTLDIQPKKRSLFQFFSFHLIFFLEIGNARLLLALFFIFQV